MIRDPDIQRDIAPTAKVIKLPLTLWREGAYSLKATDELRPRYSWWKDGVETYSSDAFGDLEWNESDGINSEDSMASVNAILTAFAWKLRRGL